MTGIVIDIATGKEIKDSEVAPGRKRNSSPRRSVVEILTPDGRRILSISRAAREFSNTLSGRRVAA